VDLVVRGEVISVADLTEAGVLPGGKQASGRKARADRNPVRVHIRDLPTLFCLVHCYEPLRERRQDGDACVE